MIDVVTSWALRALRTGAMVSKFGAIGLSGLPGAASSGVATYEAVYSAVSTRWLAAELVGRYDPSAGSVRVRIGDGTKQWYLHPTTHVFTEVSVPGSWDDEYMAPYDLASMDLWRGPVAQLFVRVERTTQDPDPTVKDALFLIDIPEWEGVVADAQRQVATLVSNVEPTLIHRESPSAPTSSWALGAPRTERHFFLRSIRGVTVDGHERPATLADGRVTLTGPPAPAGSDVVVAVTYKPNTTIRRVEENTTVDTVPAWWLQDLVVSGGLNGKIPPLMIGGYEVKGRRVELRVTVNGLADRTADALAMRAALQESIGQGIDLSFPSGRSVKGQLAGFVEVTHGALASLPMATGVIAVPMAEYTSARLVKKPRNDAGEPVRSSVTIGLGEFGGGAPEVAVNKDSIAEC